MKMRWGWTLPVLTALVTMSLAGQAWSQGGPNSQPAPAASPSAATGPAAADPAMVAAMQAQALAMQQQAAAFGPYAVPVMYGPPGMAMPGAAQYQAAMYAQQGMYPPQGIQPVAYMPMQGPAGMQPQAPGAFPVGPAPDVYGSYGYAPPDSSGMPPSGPGYGGDGGGQAMYGQGGMYGGGGQMGGDCPYCGGQGCDQCGVGQGFMGHGSWLPNGLLGDCLGLIAPYPDGGCAAPRWYDFAIDYMMLKRDNTGRNQNFTSDGVLGPIVLSSNDLDFGSYKSAVRFSAAFQLAAANSLEFTYFGQANYTSNAEVRSATGNLFSVFSDFGVIGFPFNTAEFDHADFQRIDYTSTFDSFEINWRRRWMAPNCRYQGSWTLGVRHFILDEQFLYASSSSATPVQTPTGPVPSRGFDSTYTTNNLTGIQIGTDAWVCLLPGLRVGGEFQAGVYGNHMNINTVVTVNQPVVPGVNPFRENLVANDVSFIGQANLLATYRINYQWSARVGYQFLYVDGVALAPENFNTRIPALNNPFDPRVPKTNDNGNVFYHGWNVGLEYMW